MQMHSTRIKALAPTILLLVVGVAGAQTPLVPTRMLKAIPDESVPEGRKLTSKVTVPVVLLQHPVNKESEHPVEALSRAYQRGDGRALNSLAVEIAETISCHPDFFDLPAETGKPCPSNSGRRGLDLSRDFAAIVWAGADHSGKRVVYRTIGHKDLGDPYNVTLPGLRGRKGQPILYELFLSAERAAEHSSAYVFTRQADPVEAQVPSFVAAATGPTFSSLAKLTGTLRLAAAPNELQTLMQKEKSLSLSTEPKPTATIQLSTLEPPMERSKAKVTDVVRQPVPLSEFVDQARELSSKLRFVDARDTSCAREAAERLTRSAETTAIADACLESGTTDSACRAAFDRAFRAEVLTVGSECREVLRREVTAENEARPVERRMGNAELEEEVTRRVESNLKAIQVVDGEFRKLVASQRPERLTGEGVLTNAPPTHWGLGVQTAFALTATSDKPRVKAGNDGKLVADPLGRQLTLVVINYSPRGYDPDQRPMSMSERVRPFAGIVATPDFGVAAGVSVGVWRGVGVSLGGALMFVPSLRGSDKIGLPPSDPNDSFGVARATAIIVGAAYNFK